MWTLVDMLDKKDKRQPLTGLMTATDGLARMAGFQIRDAFRELIPSILYSSLALPLYYPE